MSPLKISSDSVAEVSDAGSKSLPKQGPWRSEASRMTEAEYMDQRVGDQIRWYSRKSTSCQTRYKSLRLTEIIAAALIPFLSGMGERVPYGAWVIGMLGVVIAISAAAASLFKFHENWIQYRATQEQLKCEKFLFLTRSGPYAEDDPFQVLVQRVEKILAKENSTWAKTGMSTSKPAPAPAA